MKNNKESLAALTAYKALSEAAGKIEEHLWTKECGGARFDLGKILLELRDHMDHLSAEFSPKGKDEER